MDSYPPRNRTVEVRIEAFISSECNVRKEIGGKKEVDAIGIWIEGW